MDSSASSTERQTLGAQRAQQQPTQRIGTPATPGATRVLVLGGGEIAKELVISCQRLGLEVHSVDRQQHAPAHQVSHHAYGADVRNPEALRAVIQKVRPHIVFPDLDTVSIDILKALSATACMVVPTPSACVVARGKTAIRKIASEELGLPTPAFRYAATAEDFQRAFQDLGFPCMVKPDYPTSGRGHIIVRGSEEIATAWQKAHPSVESGPVIVERYVGFEYEATLLVVRSIDPQTGELATWFCEPIGTRRAEGRLVECWQPAAMSQQALDNARSMAARITHRLGGRGVYAVELFVSGDEVYFSSVTPRPVPAGMITADTQRFSQSDLHVRAALGMPIDVTLTTPGAGCFLLAPEQSAEISYEGLAKAMAVPEVDVQLYGKQSAYAGRAMGVVTATANSVEEARSNAAEAISMMRVHTG